MDKQFGIAAPKLTDSAEAAKFIMDKYNEITKSEDPNNINKIIDLITNSKFNTPIFYNKTSFNENGHSIIKLYMSTIKYGFEKVKSLKRDAHENDIISTNNSMIEQTSRAATWTKKMAVATFWLAISTAIMAVAIVIGTFKRPDIQKTEVVTRSVVVTTNTVTITNTNTIKIP